MVRVVGDGDPGDVERYIGLDWFGGGRSTELVVGRNYNLGVGSGNGVHRAVPAREMANDARDRTRSDRGSRASRHEFPPINMMTLHA